MNYEVRLEPSALGDLRKLQPSIRQRLITHIEKLAADPRPAGVRKIVMGEDLYRIRVGDYRVIYKLDDANRLVTVTHCRDRKDAYD